MHTPAAVLLAALATLGTAACAGTSPAAGSSAKDGAAVSVLATHLNQPKKISIMPDGDLLVALSGDGRAPSSCTNGNQRSCVDDSGAIDLITPGGRATTLLNDLPSVAASASGADPNSDSEATGPAEALDVDGTLHVLFQDTDINAKTGASQLGSAAARLGELVAYSAADVAAAIEASFGPFEAAHNPDRGAGTDVEYGIEQAIDSDPYGLVPYDGGYAVADAGGNDVLWVSPAGAISVLAVLPTIKERAVAGSYGSKQEHAIEAEAQSVPDAIAVGPDGALYVGELGGLPFDTGTSSVYRIVPGHRATVYASGFTAIADVAFDKQGRLLVLEIDTSGLDNTESRDPATGAIVRVNRNGTKTTVAGAGLHFPTGMAVAADGTVYVSDYGTTSAGADGHGGEVVTLTGASL